jgi:hypothetical protein
MLLLQYFQCHREEELDIVERKGIIINLPEDDGDVDFCYQAHHSPKDSEGLISNFQESFAEQSLAVEKCIRRDLRLPKRGPHVQNCPLAPWRGRPC